MVDYNLWVFLLALCADNALFNNTVWRQRWPKGQHPLYHRDAHWESEVEHREACKWLREHCQSQEVPDGVEDSPMLARWSAWHDKWLSAFGAVELVTEVVGDLVAGPYDSKRAAEVAKQLTTCLFGTDKVTKPRQRLARAMVKAHWTRKFKVREGKRPALIPKDNSKPSQTAAPRQRMTENPRPAPAGPTPKTTGAKRQTGGPAPVPRPSGGMPRPLTPTSGPVRALPQLPVESVPASLAAAVAPVTGVPARPISFALPPQLDHAPTFGPDRAPAAPSRPHTTRTEAHGGKVPGRVWATPPRPTVRERPTERAPPLFFPSASSAVPLGPPAPRAAPVRRDRDRPHRLPSGRRTRPSRAGKEVVIGHILPAPVRPLAPVDPVSRDLFHQRQEAAIAHARSAPIPPRRRQWQTGVDHLQASAPDQLWDMLGVPENGIPALKAGVHLRWHQLVAVVHGVDNYMRKQSTLLWDDVGLGKTLTILAIYAMIMANRHYKAVTGRFLGAFGASFFFFFLFKSKVH
jgi:hypothetical protein